MIVAGIVDPGRPEMITRIRTSITGLIDADYNR